MVGSKLLHHGLVLWIGQIGIPFVCATAVPHFDFILHRWRQEQSGLVAVFQKVVELFLAGIANDVVAINFVNRAKAVDGLDFVKLLNVEAEIVLAAFLHEFAQVFLGIKVAAHDNCDQKQGEKT